MAPHYRYLGVQLTANGQWQHHITTRLASADKAARSLHSVLRNTALPWRTRLIALNACVAPVATYAAEVWCKGTQAMRKQLDSWFMGHVTAMVHCPANASHAALQHELGILPLHVTCDKLTLSFWHRLHNLPQSRMAKQVLDAYAATASPWQTHVNALIAEYQLPTDASQLSKKDFKELLDGRLQARTQALWKQQAAKRDVKLVAQW